MDSADVRRLTHAERGLVQTFPVWWEWGDHARTHLDKMIGNAIPPNLASFVGDSIMEAIADGRSTC